MLIGLLLIDSVFIGIFVYYGIQQVISDNPAKFPQFWSLAADYSLPEFFGYAKLAVIAALLFMAFKRTRQSILCSWSIIFVVLLADDSLRLHEYGGEWVAEHLGFSTIQNIKPEHLGELVMWLVLGVIALSVLIVGLLRTPVSSMGSSGFFLVVIFGLVITGIGIDLISSASYLQDIDNGTAVSKTLYGFLLIAEDGGEAVFVSLGLAGALAVWLNSARTRS
uniref:hypothetical protein n=1 Tax=Pararhizobium sp. IMCC3301 TaxID=3067904 RepID=UPI0027405956|nr:hypothetical protein [Pararhizobium sp. IMCC3301]